MPKKVLFDHPIGRLVSFPVELPDGPVDFIRLEMPDWANVVAVTEDGDFVLVKQHRWGTSETTLEIPGGIVDPGEDALTAARRELLEETGYGGGVARALGTVRPNPAIQNNTLHGFLIEGVTKMAEPHLDPAEDIEIVFCSREELVAHLVANRIDHALAVVSLQRALWVPHHYEPQTNNLGQSLPENEDPRT